MWRSTKKLGSGGFGVVYRARRNGDDQVYALKRLLPEIAAQPEIVQRFRREIEIQAGLDHPNIVPVIDSDATAERPYFVMPYADSNLADELDDLDEEETLALFEQLLDAVEYCHARGVVHRDLKPKNILMFGGTPKISDFGLGKNTDRTSSLKTRTAAWAGTRPYAAPEQMEELRDADARADIYALGKILQELLTGRTPMALDRKLPSSFRFVIATATARDPERRFQSVEEFRDALAGVDVSNERVLPREEEAEQLLKEVESVKPRASAERVFAFHQFLASHPDDEQLILRWLPKLESDALNAYAAAYPEEFDELLRLYDSTLPRMLAFSYCDTLANFGARAYMASDDLSTRELILRMLLRVGESHDRGWSTASRTRTRGLSRTKTSSRAATTSTSRGRTVASPAPAPTRRSDSRSSRAGAGRSARSPSSSSVSPSPSRSSRSPRRQPSTALSRSAARGQGRSLRSSSSASPMKAASAPSKASRPPTPPATAGSRSATSFTTQ